MSIYVDTLLDSQFDEVTKHKLYFAIKNKQTIVIYGERGSGKFLLMHLILSRYNYATEILCISHLEEDRTQIIVDSNKFGLDQLKYWYIFDGNKETKIDRDLLELSKNIPGVICMQSTTPPSNIPSNWAVFQCANTIPPLHQEPKLGALLTEHKGEFFKRCI